MRAGFIFSEAFTGIRRNITMTIAMVLTTAISLLLLGFGLVLAKVSDKTRDIFGDRVEVSVYLTTELSTGDPNCSQDICQALLNSLQANPEVQTVDFQSQDAAFEAYQRQFAGQPEMLEIARKEALPASFQVRLNDPTRFRVISEQYTGQPGVQSVNDQSELIDKIFSFLDSVRLAAIIIAAIQGIAAVLLIANMVQVAALSRRTETNIMRLVGASRWRTQLPFMIEAVVAAVVGIALAIGGLVVAKVSLLDRVLGTLINANVLAPIDGSDIVWAAYWLVPVGVALAAVSAYTTLRLYVRM
ncbi:FtsX-like permease family protein [Nakamurella sp. YIM 132087]|uniref:Cell division protein FtsX n=1 Tax=Nakamurella alba TaxID=2665158 RepID=A0A7K1FKE6_9ACTN|nr:permease-like cell division protein FtsX [Nakamurella alba]MTD13334.1 FtsX-like permease family protein [Nakamurella alba]